MSYRNTIVTPSPRYDHLSEQVKFSQHRVSLALKPKRTYVFLLQFSLGPLVNEEGKVPRNYRFPCRVFASWSVLQLRNSYFIWEDEANCFKRRFLCCGKYSGTKELKLRRSFLVWLGDGDQITIWNENQLCHLAKASSGVTYNILQELQKFCTSILRPEIKKIFWLIFGACS